MLRRVGVKKFLLMEDIEVEFGEGINVITGETGTGKSMTIEAISFVLGKKGNYEEGTYVEMEIEKEDNEEPIIIAREIKNGRSRFYLNGRSTTLSVISDIAGKDILIHGQNDHLNILKAEYRRDILDYFGNLMDLREEFRKEYEEFNLMRKDYLKNLEEYEKLKREKEYVEMQIEELKKIDVEPDEYERIKEEVEILSRCERISQLIEKALNNLYYKDNSAYNNIYEALKLLDQVDFEDVRSISVELENILDRLKEYVRILSSNIPQVNPNRIDTLNEKIFRIQMLEKRYGKSYKEVFEELKTIENTIKSLDDFESDLLKQERILKEKEESVRNRAEALSSKRKEYSPLLERKVIEILSNLNMREVRFKVRISETSMGKYGKDKVDFLFSSSGMEPLPVEKVASGGEISRLAFALSLIKPPADTYIFDEIDTGISGETSLKLAKMIRKLGSETQVIIITHSAPMASCGDHFYKTSKEKDRISIYKLSKGEVLEEIARLMGLKSHHTLKGAMELIEEVKGF